MLENKLMEGPMPDFPVSQHHAQAFTSNVELLAQQTDHRLRGTYAMGNYVGESGQVVKQFDKVEFEEKTAKFGDTNLSELAHKQRWVFPTDFTLALPIEREDEIRTLGSLESPYASAMAAAWNRKKDSVISTALTSSAKTGKNGGTTTAFDSTMQIPVNATVAAPSGSGANTGLTVEKLILAREKLDEQEVGMDETRYMGVRRRQISDLLTDTNVTSADFNTIKALVRGDVDEFMGFKFVRYESFSVVTATDIATCPFWVGSGVHLGSWNGLQSRIAERADKNHLTQIFMRGTIGATRTQEKKVGNIQCDQSP